MSKAAQLLKETVETKKAKKDECVVVDASVPIAVGLEQPTMAAGDVAKRFRELAAQIKALETEQDTLKAALRIVGQQLLDTNAEAGHYYTQVDVAGIKVTRSNKFSPVPFSKDQLVEAVGNTEFKTLFNEKFTIVFKSIDAGRQHLTMCKEAGVEVDAEVSEAVVANSSANEYVCRIKDALDGDKLALLKVCLKDQAPRVGGK